MLIRRMEEKDLDQVAELEQEIFSEPWSRDDFAQELVAEGHCYLVAEEADQVQGYCGYWGIAGEGQIYNVAVRKEARSQGLGRQLMERLLQEGESAGLQEFTLEVRAGNESAIRLYHSVGFENAGIRKNFYSKPVEDAVIMWRR